MHTIDLTRRPRRPRHPRRPGRSPGRRLLLAGGTVAVVAVVVAVSAAAGGSGGPSGAAASGPTTEVTTRDLATTLSDRGALRRTGEQVVSHAGALTPDGSDGAPDAPRGGEGSTLTPASYTDGDDHGSASDPESDHDAIGASPTSSPAPSSTPSPSASWPSSSTSSTSTTSTTTDPCAGSGSGSDPKGSTSTTSSTSSTSTPSTTGCPPSTTVPTTPSTTSTTAPPGSGGPGHGGGGDDGAGSPGDGPTTGPDGGDAPGGSDGPRDGDGSADGAGGGPAGDSDGGGVLPGGDGGDGGDGGTVPSAVLTSLVDLGTVAGRGTILYTADDQPVVSLIGDLPAWRTLEAGVDDGADVRQLEENLVALGYAAGVDVDETFTAATAAAVEVWETDLARTDPDGVVTIGDVVFVSAPGDVLGHEASVGDTLDPGTPVLSIGAEQRVVVGSVDATAAGGWAAGSTVDIEWVDGSVAEGTVFGTGRNVTDGKVDLVVAVDDAAAGGRRSGAEAAITLLDARRDGAVAVPVAAIVDDGGAAAVRVVRPDVPDELVPVDTGLVADGWVEVTGGLEVGERVRLPG